MLLPPARQVEDSTGLVINVVPICTVVFQFTVIIRCVPVTSNFSQRHLTNRELASELQFTI